MSIFKHDREIKRMIFNVYADLAESLEALKAEAKLFDKRLDVDTAVNKALDKFVKKAAKKIEDMRHAAKDKRQKSPPDAAAPETEACIRDDESRPGGQTQEPGA